MATTHPIAAAIAFAILFMITIYLITKAV